MAPTGSRQARRRQRADCSRQLPPCLSGQLPGPGVASWCGCIRV